MTNEEKIKAAKREYMRKYQESLTTEQKAVIKERRQEYYKANKDRICERNREWRQNNPEKVAEMRERYWLKKFEALGLADTDEEVKRYEHL